MDLDLGVKDLESVMKPLNIISRLLGLTLYSPLFEQGLDDYSLKNLCIKHPFITLWTLIMFLIGLAAFIFRIVITFIEPPYYPSTVISCALAMPLSHLSGLFAIALSANWNTKKMSELFFRLALIDKCLRINKNKSIYKKHNKILLTGVIILVIGLSAFYCFDIYVWSTTLPSTSVYEIFIHICYLINAVVLMQFLNWIECLHSRLWIFAREIPMVNTSPMDNSNIFFISRRKGIDFRLRKNRRLVGINSDAETSKDFLFLPIHQKYSFTFSKFSYRNMLSKQVLQLRKVYEYMYDVSKLILSIYGFLMLLEITSNLLFFVSNTFSALNILINYEEKAHVEFTVVYFGWSFISLVKIMVIVVPCHKISRERESCVDRVQKLLLLRDLPEDAFTQLQLFADQLEYQKLKFSACGFFQLDLSLLNDIMTAAATYIIVLVQTK